MKIVKVKRLKTRSEIEGFIEGYNNAYSTKKIKNKQALLFGSLVKYDYVFGLFLGSKMHGGFIVNKFPNRCLDSFNTKERDLLIEKFSRKGDLSEVVAIWKDSKISRFSLWGLTTLAALFYGKKYIFGCAYKGHGMTKNYYLLSPSFIKEGHKVDDLEVFYYTKLKFFLSFFVGALKALRANPIKLFFPHATHK